MNLKLHSLAIATCLAIAALAAPGGPSYAQVRLPSLGESESEEFNIIAERRVGDQIMREIRRDPDVLDDPVLTEYLDSIFSPLVDAARQRGDISPEVDAAFGWEPFLVRDRTFNAFALPGGFVGVHLGLIAAAGSSDEMASVLGHELSHITQRHIARSIVNAKHSNLATLAAMLAGLIVASRSGNADVPAAIITGGQAAMATGQLTFSREMEREADRFGLDVMTSAGFAPGGMSAMFERLETVSRLNDSNQYPYLRSHPLTIERIAEARLRARGERGNDSALNRPVEHAMMRARARALMDASEPALRRMQGQGQAQATAPMNDADRLGAVYGAALASILLRDFVQADAMLAKAFEVDGAPASAPTNAPASAPAIANAARDLTSPRVRRDLALLRLDLAEARRSAAAIAAASTALDDDRTRPAMLAQAEAAVGRATAGDPAALPELKRQTERLQTWVSERPRDALAWSMLARCAEPAGLKLRAIRAEAESHAAQGDLIGAIDRLRAGQRLSRGPSTDFVEASIIDSRLRQLEAEMRQFLIDNKGQVPGG